jgi:hypothetical protein
MNKSTLVTTFFAIIILSISSCQKCITCKNVCYDCGPSSNILCSSNFPTQAAFDALLVSVESTGRTCIQTTSTESFDVCDDKKTVKNFQDYYEQSLYRCESK